MEFLKTSPCWLIFFFTLVQSYHAAISCPPSTPVKLNTFCHHSQVSVPFPFECDATPVNYCHNAENLLQPNNSTKVYLDGNRFFDGDLIGNCWNDSTTTYSQSGHWQIKLDTIQNIYAVLVRTLGPARNQSSSLRVSLTRHVSSNRSETTRCHDFNYRDGYHTFYCYHPDEALTTSYRPGFDAKFVDIVGEVYIDETCDFTNIVKLYSYPVRVCGIPEAHHNQTIEPYANYYLIGQQVTYRCSDDVHTLIGQPDRVCQHNGLWSGNTPMCVLVRKFQPQTQLIHRMGNTELYWPADRLSNATRLDEMEMITYGFEAEYCINRTLLEYHSGTELSVYTTSVNGTRHIWAANGTFGKYSNKQYFVPRVPFVCCSNVTIQRHQDLATRAIFKRSEFIYQIEADGYRHREFYCLRPHLFPNMKFSIKPNHTIENGVTVTIECSKGFHQQNADPAEILCENGMWKGRFPICERKHCPQPIKRSHSSWNYENKGLKFNQVRYKCDHGFELQGRNAATCIDGRWTTPSPTCKVTFCPSVVMPPNLFCMLNRKNEFYDATGNGTVFHHGISLVCYCQFGFRAIGNRTVRCDNQEWTSELPQCQKILCGSPPFLIPSGANNSIIQQRHWEIGLHNFTCPDELVIKDYNDQTSLELICQENGEWGETEVFECVNQTKGLECYVISGIVMGVILGLALITVSVVFGKRLMRKADKTKKINESRRNLTIVEDDYNQSYISYSEEMDEGPCIALIDGYMTKPFYSTYDTKLIESSESEIDVETF
ncbi:CUB and sushi domain-containing protein 1-like isoform X2 [Daphnia pulicaria]|uniref:CUB and sushi domain-containing protein 1-like isoform X2 n=1 Tax=Daphnia pulicaria TaxID=35523 RepID=UPI001EECA76A|nr:CUB and sushi domain-containing protein 1-like isoform X2 [Daphnia pulicaria]